MKKKNHVCRRRDGLLSLLLDGVLSCFWSDSWLTFGRAGDMMFATKMENARD